MAYIAADGPPDVDAAHQWAPATGSTPPAINAITGDTITFPWVRIEQITGYRTAPEADDNREARTNADGEIPYPGRLLGKTIVYEAEIQATTRESLAATLTGLLNGFGDRSGLGTMTVTPYSTIGGVVWMYQARVLTAEAAAVPTYDQFLQGPWRRTFTLSLRMLNPRFYTPDLGGAAYL